MLLIDQNLTLQLGIDREVKTIVVSFWPLFHDRGFFVFIADFLASPTQKTYYYTLF